jgi:hypothetical protein
MLPDEAWNAGEIRERGLSLQALCEGELRIPPDLPPQEREEEVTYEQLKAERFGEPEKPLWAIYAEVMETKPERKVCFYLEKVCKEFSEVLDYMHPRKGSYEYVIRRVASEADARALEIRPKHWTESFWDFREAAWQRAEYEQETG